MSRITRTGYGKSRGGEQALYNSGIGSRLLAAVAALGLLACGPASLSADRAIAILISIDGFRSDYLDVYRPPVLTALADAGIKADGLIPQFPSKTFPNHYTLVTGLRLARHGIVSNNMRAPDIPGDFALANRDVLADPRWWGGEPVWNTAERQGRRASAMFWPGSEAAIGGRRATYWMPYDHTMPNDVRVSTTLRWLRQPEDQRPSFLTLYFSDLDTAGHGHGPESGEVRDAVARVDRSLAHLVHGVGQAGLSDRVHYIVVSDHGMAALSPDRVIVLDEFVDPATVDVVDWIPVLALSPRDGDVDGLMTKLRGRHPALTVYRSTDLPARYGLAGHPRIPPVIAIPDEGWFVTSRREMAAWTAGGRHAPGGTHGYDPQLDEHARGVRGRRSAAAARDARARLREHPRVRVPVRAAGPRAGAERRRPVGHARHAQVIRRAGQPVTHNSTANTMIVTVTTCSSHFCPLRTATFTPTSSAQQVAERERDAGRPVHVTRAGERRQRQTGQQHHHEHLHRVAAHQVEARDRRQRQRQKPDACLEKSAVDAGQKESGGHAPVPRAPRCRIRPGPRAA